MDRQAVRHVFDQIAASLSLKGDNPFRIRAFENAARVIAEYPGDLDEAIRSGALAEGPGDRPGHARDRARARHHRSLEPSSTSCANKSRRGWSRCCASPGWASPRCARIHEALQIDSLAELEEAAADGRLAGLPQFGAKTAEKVRKGIAALRRAVEFRLFHHARAEAETLRRALATEPGVERVEIAGSVRRCCEIIRDVDLVVQHAPGAAAALVQRLGETPRVTEFVGKEGAVTLRFESGLVADVFLATAADFGTALVRATGSAAHLRQLEARGFDPHRPLPRPKRTSIAPLGIPWIAPELREGLGEIEAAAEGTLPALVEQRDLKGFLHCHTNYSDGSTTVAQWAEAARAAGYAWIGITDHSGSASYAGGLKAGDVPRQHEEIDAVNARTRRRSGAQGRRGGYPRRRHARLRPRRAGPLRLRDRLDPLAASG